MKWTVGLLLGLALVVVAVDVVEQRAQAERAALAPAFERNVVLCNGLANIGTLYDELGEAEARAALIAAAARLGQVVFDGGDRVCLWGATAILRESGRSEATLELHDLSTAAGWQSSSYWTTSHPDANIDAVRFVAGQLLVEWHDATGQPQHTEIAWSPGTLPGPGRLE